VGWDEKQKWLGTTVRLGGWGNANKQIMREKKVEKEKKGKHKRGWTSPNNRGGCRPQKGTGETEEKIKKTGKGKKSRQTKEGFNLKGEKGG